MWHDYFILASLSVVKGATLQSPKKPLATFPFVTEACSMLTAYHGKPPDRSIPGGAALHNPPNSSPTAWQRLQPAGQIKQIPICQ